MVAGIVGNTDALARRARGFPHVALPGDRPDVNANGLLSQN